MHYLFAQHAKSKLKSCQWALSPCLSRPGSHQAFCLVGLTPCPHTILLALLYLEAPSAPTPDFCLTASQTLAL